MRFAELFAGAGGLSMGLEWAGHECVWHAEIEPHARAVLRHRWPTVPLYGDVTQLDGKALVAAHGPIDLLTGGSPCQDLSVAGKRAGLEGERSGLFHQQVRLWRETGADVLLWENVMGALSSQGGADFQTVLEELSGTSCARPDDGWPTAGIIHGPDGRARVAYRSLDLQWFGPPQRRRRVFVCAVAPHALDRYDPAALLFADAAGGGLGASYRAQVRAQCHGLRGDFAPGGEAGEGVALSLASRTRDGDKQIEWQPDLAHALGSPSNGGRRDAGMILPAAYPLLKDRHDGSPCADRGQPVVAVGLSTELNTGYDLMPTLSSPSVSGGGHPASVLAFDTTQMTSAANRSNPQPGDPCHPLASGAHPPAVTTVATPQWPKDIADTLTLAYAKKWGLEDQHINSGAGLFVMSSGQANASVTRANEAVSGLTNLNEASVVVGRAGFGDWQESGQLTARGHKDTDFIAVVPASSVVAVRTANTSANGHGIAEDVTHTTDGAQGQAVMAVDSVVAPTPRRLTPLECERLMGWPDQHTAHGVKEDGTAYALPDSARYRLCGNGVGSPVTAWIGRMLGAA